MSIPTFTIQYLMESGQGLTSNHKYACILNKQRIRLNRWAVRDMITFRTVKKRGLYARNRCFTGRMSCGRVQGAVNSKGYLSKEVIN